MLIILLWPDLLTDIISSIIEFLILNITDQKILLAINNITKKKNLQTTNDKETLYQD